MRCLVPVGVPRLVVAGRPISATHEAAGSIRGQAVCLVTGHAAGVLAACAASETCSPGELDPAKVQAVLTSQRAVLERRDRILAA